MVQNLSGLVAAFSANSTFPPGTSWPAPVPVPEVGIQTEIDALYRLADAYTEEAQAIRDDLNSQSSDALGTLTVEAMIAHRQREQILMVEATFRQLMSVLLQIYAHILEDAQALGVGAAVLRPSGSRTTNEQ